MKDLDPPQRRAERWSHSHVFDPATQAAERGTRVVTWITLAMMVVEIAAGLWFNSMALLADGMHMSSHALAIGLAAFAYSAARRYAKDVRFAFGTWKIEVLAAYSSAIFLLVIAIIMLWTSAERLVHPQQIQYLDAIWVAVIGLLVNLACALVLARAGGHSHSHGEGEPHHHHDLNLKAAYIHVLADALTSVFAIVALVGGLMFDWAWLDAAMGIVGAILVAAWAKNILIDAGKVLLDREMDHPIVERIRETIEQSNAERVRIQDLHVWRVGRRSYACVLSLNTQDTSLTPASVRQMLSVHDDLAHATVEINLEAGGLTGALP